MNINIGRSRKIGYVLGFTGLLSILAAGILSPGFVTNDLFAGRQITAEIIHRLQILRFLSLTLGSLLVTSGTLLVKVDPSTLLLMVERVIHNEALMVGVIILFGAALRLFHLFFVGISSPYRFGGLFLEFSQQIYANRFALPMSIPFYTDGGIPFAYPPLPFYVEAFLVYILKLPKFSVVNLSPPIVTILTLPSFYKLTREVGFDYIARLASLLAFVSLPNAFIHQIEGGGLAEAFGTLSIIWFVIALVRSYKFNTVSTNIITGLTWAVCILSSPGSAFASILTFLIFTLAQVWQAIRQKKPTPIGLAIIAGLVAVVSSSPYWLTVVSRHGIQIFADTFGAIHIGLAETFRRSFDSLLQFQIADGSYTFIWNLCIFIGVVWGIFKRQWGILLWFVVLQITWREGMWLVSIPAALLAGVGFIEIIYPALLNTFERYEFRKGKMILIGGVLMFGGLWILVNLSKFMVSLSYPPRNTLSIEAMEAMKWISQNTPEEIKLVVLSGSQVVEWVPQISRRTVLNMEYGSEWQPKESIVIEDLNFLIYNCENYDCLYTNVTTLTGYKDFTLYLEKYYLEKLGPIPDHTQRFDIQIEWENEEVIVASITEQ